MLPLFLKPYDVKITDLIRIGPKSDGGYVIHKDSIHLTKKIITCGLNDDWKFEKNFKRLNNDCSVDAYDHTVNKDFWIKRFKKDIIHFFLLKKLRIKKIIKMFDYLDYKKFFKDENKHFQKKIVKNSKEENEVEISKLLKNNNDFILKVDIEGDEYEILADITHYSKKIISLIIEFHDLEKNINKLKKFITENEFLKLIHIHGNNFSGVDLEGNPNVVELTFVNINKIYISQKKTKNKYPISGLDFKNSHRKKEIKLNFYE